MNISTNFDEISWLNLNSYVRDEYALILSCKNENLEMAKLLLKLSHNPVNIHIKNELALGSENEKFEVAKLLLNLSQNSLNIHVRNENTFVPNCENGK